MKMIQSSAQPDWEFPLIGDSGRALTLIYSILTALTIIAVVLIITVEFISLFLPPPETLIWWLQIVAIIAGVLVFLSANKNSLRSPNPSMQTSYRVDKKKGIVVISVSLSKVPEDYIGTDKLRIRIRTPEEIVSETTSSIEVIPDEDTNSGLSTTLFNFEMDIEDINKDIGGEDLVTIIANVGDWTDKERIPLPKIDQE